MPASDGIKPKPKGKVKPKRKPVNKSVGSGHKSKPKTVKVSPKRKKVDPAKNKWEPPKHPGGRPTVVTPEVLAKLEYAFALGCSDLEACFYADIYPSTLYRYQEANPEFSERKKTLKKRPIMLAREVIVDALVGDDVNSAHKVLDRHDGTKQIIAGDPEAPLQVVTRIELVPLGTASPSNSKG